MTKLNRKYRWLYVGIGAAALFILGFLYLQSITGIRVAIQNDGDTAMRSVVLHVTGGTFPVGDIAPGAIGMTKVRCAGESSLEIEFTDGNGEAKRLNADQYFESGYRGTIRISIRDGVIEDTQQQISVW